MQDLARWERRPERVGALARIPAVLGAAGYKRQRRLNEMICGVMQFKACIAASLTTHLGNDE
jgi:hypothetical protein